MTSKKEQNGDASFYYYANATADVARMDSSAVYGNLADAMKDATVLFPPPHETDRVVLLQRPHQEKKSP